MKLRQQYLTRNDCYKAGRRFAPKGAFLHATGADNPNVCRYVPGDGEMGVNTGGNHWNRSGLSKCVHGFIGKFADGSIGTVQTLPWDMRGWHAGKRAGNDGYIGVEICEDGLDDPVYFAKVYREAVELFAMLSLDLDWDPLKDGVILCHAEGYKRGIASNHADVLHWFPRHGKSMDDFRADVAREMEGVIAVSYEQFVEYMKRYEAEKAEQPASAWARPGLEQAMKKGITDGSRPQSLATRQEVALMVNAAVK